MKKTYKRSYIYKTLGISLLAAAWLIAGPDWLTKLGLQNAKIIELLTLIPALTVMFTLIAARPGFVACERRTFKRILGIK